MNIYKLTKLNQLLIALMVAIAGLILLSANAHAATFPVDSTGDGVNTGGSGVCDDGSGACTLRAAIEAANATAGTDIISFGIAGAGVHSISIGSDLPSITETVTIDGTTQSGASCGTLVPTTLPSASNTVHTLLIEVVGADSEAAFWFTGSGASNSTLKGLIVNHTYDSAFVDSADNITLECNYLGTDSTGTSPEGPFNIGIEGYDADGMIVNNNLIAGNADGETYFEDATNLTIQNNIIGLNASGTSTINNGSSDGIYVNNSSYISTGIDILHNIIGGSLNDGMSFNDSDTVNVKGNFIGLSLLGGAAGNGGNGIYGYGDNFIVGGPSPTDRNFISNNDSNGTNIYSNSSSTLIQNNVIGLNGNGTSAAGNGTGIYSGSNGDQVYDNIISGNIGDGLYLQGNNADIKGNTIGLDLNNDPLGNEEDGIENFRAYNPTIGGAGAGERNTISANKENGINIWNSEGSGCPYTTVSNTIGNYIGTNTSGEIQTGYGNSGSGISVHEDSNDSCIMTTSVYQHVIGGDSDEERNTIAGNALDGIRVFQSQYPTFSTDVFSISLLPNSIYGNGNLGINLATDSDNDGTADTDLGPNAINAFLMSYPATNANYYLNHATINTASFSGTDITVDYDFQANGVEDNDPYLLSSDLVGYRLDFYLNDAGQDGAYAGYSQGKTHIGSFIVDGSETGATHTFTSPVTPTAGQVVTVSATVLWQILPFTGACPDRVGDGPPYYLDFSGCPT